MPVNPLQIRWFFQLPISIFRLMPRTAIDDVSNELLYLKGSAS
jgi:hypothetical protein